MRLIRYLSAVSMMLLLIASTACALEVRVDLDDEAPAPGGNWNSIPSPNTTTSNLTDFVTGAGTGIDLATSDWEGGVAYAGGWVGGDKGFVTAAAAHDLFYTNRDSIPGIVTFRNVPTGSYTVDVVSANGGTTPEDVRVNGTITSDNFDNLSGVSSDNFDEYTQGQDNYLTWSGIMPVGANNEITISFLRLDPNLGSALVQTVRLISEPATPAKPTTWGKIKSLYRAH